MVKAIYLYSLQGLSLSHVHVAYTTIRNMMLARVQQIIVQSFQCVGLLLYLHNKCLVRLITVLTVSY